MYLWVSVLVKPPQKEWCWEFASRFGCVLTHALYIGGGFIDFHSQEQHTFGVLLFMLSVHVHVHVERERERELLWRAYYSARNVLSSTLKHAQVYLSARVCVCVCQWVCCASACVIHALQYRNI